MWTAFTSRTNATSYTYCISTTITYPEPDLNRTLSFAPVEPPKLGFHWVLAAVSSLKLRSLWIPFLELIALSTVVCNLITVRLTGYVYE